MKKALVSFAVVSALAVYSLPADAQCSMCRRIAESNTENSKQQFGKGLNKGILYLLSIPYILGGAAGIMWYRAKKRS